MGISMAPLPLQEKYLWFFKTKLSSLNRSRMQLMIHLK